jgi:hypothetical protein
MKLENRKRRREESPRAGRGNRKFKPLLEFESTFRPLGKSSRGALKAVESAAQGKCVCSFTFF